MNFAIIMYVVINVIFLIYILYFFLNKDKEEKYSEELIKKTEKVILKKTEQNTVYIFILALVITAALTYIFNLTKSEILLFPDIFFNGSSNSSDLLPYEREMLKIRGFINMVIIFLPTFFAIHLGELFLKVSKIEAEDELTQYVKQSLLKEYKRYFLCAVYTIILLIN